MKRDISSVILAIVCVAVSPHTWADISEAAFIPQGSDVYQSVPVDQVEVFVYKPDFKFKIIGVIEARGMAEFPTESLLDQLDIIGKLTKAPSPLPGEKEDIALAIKALREEAANAGATGVVILTSRQVQVSPYATERQIKAVAIQRVP